MYMGTFLYEYVEAEPFEEKELLLTQLKEILHDFGECSLEIVKLLNKQIALLEPYDFSRVEKDENTAILAYNRFEHDTWEPTFLNLDLNKFSGIRARSFGSKVGYRNHYYANEAV